MKNILIILLLLSVHFSFSQVKTAQLNLSNCALELTKQQVTYDPSYFSISYPNGDVPSDKGVCTDVVIRAYRKIGVDLQKNVHEDMKVNFNVYPKIWDLYKQATAYMKSKNQVHWPKFSEQLIIDEIEENRQWKLLIDGEIACIWATAFDDELIWGDKNKEPSLYIHRIATDSKFRGQNLVGKLIEWANEYGKKHNLKYLRMDTVGHNKGLISHYGKLGFQFLGIKPLENTDGLPDHYKDGEVCFFQKDIV